jgi:hypothetical protein
LFKVVKDYLLLTKFLVYFDLNYVLYLKINGLIKQGFSIIVFYLEKDYKVLTDLAKIASIAVKLIMFLSKLLGNAKKNYHLTKLEVIYLV